MSRVNLIEKLNQIKQLAEECLQELGQSSPVSGKPVKKRLKLRTADTRKFNFNMHIRAFIKIHAKSLSGPRRFALLVARLTKGKTSQVIPMKEITRQWNKMRGLLDGELNNAHATRAKESGWVDSKKHGFYQLSPSWKDIFKSKS